MYIAFMATDLKNWQTQIKKGYLELCILNLLSSLGETYGFQLAEKLRDQDLDIKEGTLYPLLNRMEEDGLLKAKWVTEVAKGNPKKYYSLSALGNQTLKAMNLEFTKMNQILKNFTGGH